MGGRLNRHYVVPIWRKPAERLADITGIDQPQWRASCRDYYQNYFPSRDQVMADTKGSYEYVVEHMGETYADEMKAVL